MDEELFIRKCAGRGIDYAKAKGKLFDLRFSGRGRLRWLNNITSAKILVDILGKPKEALADFIEIYQNSFQEKEKLWRRLGIKGQFCEKAGRDILKEALKTGRRSCRFRWRNSCAIRLPPKSANSLLLQAEDKIDEQCA